MSRPREFDEPTVVDAAMLLFWQRGYQATSVQDLVEATGLQRGSLYGAFGDKHGLLMRSLDVYVERPIRRLEQLLAESPDPIDALRGFIRMAGVDSQDDELARRGCLMGNTCVELAPHDEAARLRVDGFITRLRNAMADAVRAAQEIGSFDPGRDADAVAMFIQCSLQGLALLNKSGLDPQLIASVVDEVLAVLDRPDVRTTNNKKETP